MPEGVQGTAAPAGAGRPVGSRQKIAEALIADLPIFWQKNGVSVLERLAKEEPAKLATIAYGLLPRDVFVSVQDQRAHLSGVEWNFVVPVLKAVQQALPNANELEPEEVAEFVTNALRAAGGRTITDIESVSNQQATENNEKS